MRMQKTIIGIFAGLLMMVSSCTTDPDIAAARDLADRIVPQYAGKISFEKLTDSVDVYELESQKGGRLIIRGNNSNAMAVGLNRYLTEWCHSTVSWYDYNKTVVPQEMPVVEHLIRVKSTVKNRFFLNYCTFGYTMPWWTWKEWEHFIDWMALNGVNMPLAITGQEAVWQRVWKEYGMTDEEIRTFLVGPAHLPWQRMGNIDGWQGPLPQHWIDSQAALQKKIVARERSLGMHPVLPAFAGHIPARLAEVFPRKEPLDTSRVSPWGGFADKYRCTFLNPMDSAFVKIQQRFMEIQTEMYGTDHIYGVDPFNEVEPPSWDPETLARYSSHIFESLTMNDPEAVWLQMGWMFYYDNEHWTPDNIRAYLTAVPQGKMMLLDYYCELQQVWKHTDRFFGQPYIWCYLGNFGGNTLIEGDFKTASQRIAETLGEGGRNLAGIGSTLEGFGVNEPVYQFILSKAWQTGISDTTWINNMADSRFGRRSDSFRKAWHILYEEIYNSCSATGHGTLTNAYPCLEGCHYWTTQPDYNYDNSRLKEVLDLMNEQKSETDAYLFDVVNVTRQYLGNSFISARDDFNRHLLSRDTISARESADRMLDILSDMDRVLSSRKEFSLQDWIASARQLGTTPDEADYYETNARTIITVWGDSDHLSGYANRNLSGLTATYYRKRWKLFIEHAFKALHEGKTIDEQQLDKILRQFDWQWTKQDQTKR